MLKRMQALCILMKEVVTAEHPNFEVISRFGIFDLASFPQETVQKVLKRGGGHEDKFDKDLKNLAHAFNVNEVGLLQEFWDYGGRAAIRYKQTSCSNISAWESALQATSRLEARKRHPCSNLEVVLAEYICISCSDSIIEHDFSRVKKLLGEHRLNCKEETESDLVMVLLNAPEHDGEMIQLAPFVWHELYSASRLRTGPPRIDKGTKRRVNTDLNPPDTPSSSSAWAI